MSWNHIQGIVKRFHRQTEREFEEINKQLGIIAASTTILERELRDRWNLKSKLRIHSYYKAARSPSTAAMEGSSRVPSSTRIISSAPGVTTS